MFGKIIQFNVGYKVVCKHIQCLNQSFWLRKPVLFKSVHMQLSFNTTLRCPYLGCKSYWLWWPLFLVILAFKLSCPTLVPEYSEQTIQNAFWSSEASAVRLRKIKWLFSKVFLVWNYSLTPLQRSMKTVVETHGRRNFILWILQLLIILTWFSELTLLKPRPHTMVHEYCIKTDLIWTFPSEKPETSSAEWICQYQEWEFALAQPPTLCHLLTVRC